MRRPWLLVGVAVAFVGALASILADVLLRLVFDMMPRWAVLPAWAGGNLFVASAMLLPPVGLLCLCIAAWKGSRPGEREQCPSCGHDRYHLPVDDKCPECGTVPKAG